MPFKSRTGAMNAPRLDSSISTALTRQAFTYAPLDYSLDPDAIRLLRVLPDLLVGYIQVELRQGPTGIVTSGLEMTDQNSVLVGQSSDLGYRCLSYTWGEPSEGCDILLNGCIFRVRENLFEFLNTSRRLYPLKQFWIDAISIDQSNLAERGHQVERMNRIYEGATEVLIWLGIFPSWEPVAAYLKSHHSYRWFPPLMVKQAKDVMCHPYWSRAWITQEIVLAKSIRLIYAAGDVEFKHLCALLDAPVIRISKVELNTRFFFRMCDLEPCGWRDGQNGLHSLVLHQSTTNCADNRDRIYSILGLVPDGKDFSVDYEEPSLDLFWRAGQYLQLWHHTGLFHLQSALGLRVQQLRDSLKHRAAPWVTLPVHYAYSERTRISRLPQRIRCGQESIQIRCEARHEVLLCTCKDKKDGTPLGCSHILLFPTSDVDPGIGFTHVARFHSDFANIELKGCLLQTANPLPQTSREKTTQEAAIDSRSEQAREKQDGWITVTQWVQLIERLNTRDNNELPGKWRLVVPARNVLAHLQMLKYNM